MEQTSLHILSATQDPAARRAFAMHDRVWQSNHYVYPVVSRRSKGISIGVNLNPDKACNFDCIYCSVDRTVPPPVRTVDLPRLESELRTMLQVATSGEIYQFDPFDRIPVELRRINDIAFSGDGEPTTFPQFAEIVQLAATVKKDAPSTGTPIKLVLISNATMFHRPQVQRGLQMMDQNNGEIWGKLDAGTAGYYDLIDRTSVPFQRVLDNLLDAARVRPIVIQSLFMRVRGILPPDAEIDAYIQRLAAIVSAGGRIKLVQLYTVARRTTESYATAMSEPELQMISSRMGAILPGLPVEIYP